MFVWKHNQSIQSSRMKDPYAFDATMNDVQGVNIMETPSNFEQLLPHAQGLVEELYDRTQQDGSLILTSK